MNINLAAMRGKVRIAIDEIAGASVSSDFTENLNTEINQAIRHAVLQLCDELPDDFLMPKEVPVADVVQYHGSGSADDGTGEVALPLDFLRLVKFKLASWDQSVRELLDPLSDEAKMQASKWTRGNPQKPKAMLGGSKLVDGDNNTSAVHRLMEYYTAGKTTSGGVSSYDHTVDCLFYIPMVEEGEGTLSAPLRDSCEPYIIYRAAGILMEGKQHGDLADRFYKLSIINQTVKQ